MGCGRTTGGEPAARRHHCGRALAKCDASSAEYDPRSPYGPLRLNDAAADRGDWAQAKITAVCFASLGSAFSESCQDVQLSLAIEVPERMTSTNSVPYLLVERPDVPTLILIPKTRRVLSRSFARYAHARAAALRLRELEAPENSRGRPCNAVRRRFGSRSKTASRSQ